MSILLRKGELRHMNSVAHEGKLVIVGTDAAARLWFTVRQDGYEDSYLRIPAEQRTGWEDWQPLALPDEPVDDASVIAQEDAELSHAAEPTRLLMRSRYRSAALSALAPVQLVSALGHVYVFRQSTEGTLLVDRFVLDGMTNQLIPKLQVRYKRSRQKNRPIQSMRKGAQGLEDVDTLDFSDAEGRPFHEPSTELRAIDNLQDGWFSVVLVPTAESDVLRWHIFAFNRRNQTIDLTTLRASDEGLFAWRDYRAYDPTGSVPVGPPIAGILRRSFSFTLGGTPLAITGGPVATAFDLQQEQATQSGEMQLLKTSSRVMLAVPGSAGIMTVSLAIASDGTLSEVGGPARLEAVRSTRREVLLPLDTLDAIKAYADASPPPPTGTITGLGRSIDRGSEDRIEVQTAPGAAATLADGDTVTLSGTRLFEGRHRVSGTRDGDHFDIDIAAAADLGRWERQEDQRSGLVFDGMISSYEITAEGRLRITCPGHGLGPGDEVQILGPEGIDGSYAVRRIDDQRFVIDGRWAAAEAMNLQLASRKRRGIVLDGVGDYLEIPASDASTMGVKQDFTLELWIKVEPQADAAPAKDIVFKMSAVRSLGYGYAVSYLSASRQIAIQLDHGLSALQVVSRASIDDTGFHHVALVKDGAQLRLYLDGDLARGTTATIDLSGVSRQITNTDGTLYLGRGVDKNNFFRGQLSDLRLWTTARSADDLRRHMSLMLTGTEAGLAGCWRLGAVADGQINDTSVRRNDGRAHGHAHVSATRFDRTLGSGLAVFKYSNPELIAVSQRSTYEESFEFRLDPPPADASGAEVFTFVHWGRASRSSDEDIAAGTATEQNPVEALADDPGWYRASARITIPDGMAMLRCFEVVARPDAPAWQSAEIRRHRIAWVSDSISASMADAPLALKAVPATALNAHATLATLASFEQQEAALWLERRRLESSLAKLSAPGALQTAIAAEAAARSARDAARSALDREVANPLNYWCTIRGAAGDYANDHWGGVGVGNDLLIFLTARFPAARFQAWKFVKVDADHYEIVCRSYPDSPCTYVAMGDNDVRIQLLPRSPGITVQKWILGTPAGISAGVFCISPLWWPDCVCLKVQVLVTSLVGLRKVSAASRVSVPSSLWFPERIGDERSNTVIDDLQADHERLNDMWVRADKALRDLQGNTATLTARLAAIKAELDRLRAPGVLPAASRAALQAIDGARRTPMASAITIADAARDLHSRAALLTSVRPASRVTALANCDGNVQLNYFDARGCMRRTSYDAVADNRNASFEQWLPDGPRACLNFGKDDILPVDIDLATTTGWTIEAWFSFPLPDVVADAPYNTLACGPLANNSIAMHAMVDREGRLGILRNGTFVDAGFDMDLLEPGWHHLAAVGMVDTTLFYIDGARVGDTKQALAKALREANEAYEAGLKELNAAQGDAAKTVEATARLAQATQSLSRLAQSVPFIADRVRALGNYTHGSQPFGKLAELRIWGVALDADEIAANSKTLLSGNEPDLLACYPLDEGTGAQVRDLVTGSAVNLSPAPTWWGCTAAIGHTSPAGGRALQFDGTGQCVEVPYAAELNPPRFSLACWARVTGGQGTWRSVITSRNVGPTRGYIIYAGQNNKWQFWVGDGSDGAWAICTGADAASDVVPYRWTHLAASFDGTKLVFCIDGVAVASANARYATNGPANGRALRIGAGTTETSLVRYPFAGQIAQLCLWNRALNPQEVARGMNMRHLAGEAGLVACWPLDQITTDAARAGSVLAREVVGGRHGLVKGATTEDDRWLPIVPDTLLCEEYSTIGRSSRGNVATMRRCLAYPAKDGALVLPQQRIELLELKWLGNAQFAPTLLGYIEGAPPVPSENLTMADDYNGAASVELTTSDDVEYKWTRTQDSGLGASVEAFLGGGGKVSVVAAPLGVGSEIETSTKAGFKGNLDFNYQFQNESSVAASSSLATTDRIELRGTPESKPRFAHLGNRFIPKNVGYALVVSALADVFITRLARSKRMIGYQVKPVEGLPPDVNTITFMMNPAYTMNGSLDGLTGSAATSERFFKQVPQMRAEFGSLYPASYYRLREAYDLKAQIEKADKQRESYFANFDVGMVDQLSLDRHIDAGDAPAPVTTKPDVPSAGASSAPSDQAAKDFAAHADAAAAETGDAAGKRQDEIKKRIDDLGKQSHASVAFAAWQLKMEDLRIRAGKRNIVNTYVWDADGGLRSESQSFANTVEHSIGGSFALNAALGAEAEFEAGISVELTAQATVNMTQTMSKTESTSKGLELVVDLGGLEFRGITDYKDNPILPGEKVDRYRFMSFYLEGSDQNFQDFFSTVVDPEWLASNDEEARALRQARAGKSNKAWRVLHRVTYVERPALMGFGSARRTVTAAETSDYQLLLDKVTRLEDTLAKLLAAKGL